MKNTIAFLLCLIVFVGISNAQQTRFHFYSGYAFDDKVDSYYDANNYYNGKINGNFIWGGGFELLAKKNLGIELQYLRMDTDVPMVYFNQAVKNKVFKVGINQIMLSSNRYFKPTGEKIELYCSPLIGLTIFSIKNPDIGGSSSITKFGYGLKLGSNFWLSDNIGIKLQSQLLSAAQAVGGGVYFGTGGTSVGLNSYSSFWQFALAGGIVIKLNK